MSNRIGRLFVAELSEKKGGFYLQKDCDHNIHSSRCSIKKNGDCKICDKSYDQIKMEERPSYVTEVERTED